MRISKSSLTLTAMLAVCGFLLVGCGSSGAGTSTNTVTSTESPIPNTSGVKASLEDGTQVYLLSENTNSDETKSMKIISDPNKTGGDTSELVGKTFLEFSNLSGIHDKATLTASNSSEVYECDLVSESCMVIPHINNNENSISFYVSSGRFYAVKK